MNLLISKVARLLGISAQTIRNYEKAGLLQNAISENNYRNFTSPDITLLLWIKKYRDLGFSLKEIRTILTTEPTARLELLKGKIADIDRTIEELRLIRACVEHKADNCRSIIDSAGKICIEARGALHIILYSHNRVLFESLFDNNDFSTLIHSVLPLQYITLLPREDFVTRRNEYYIGLSVTDEYLHLLPPHTHFLKIPPQICVSVILNHPIEKGGDDQWTRAEVIRDLERCGLYRFLEEHHLTPAGDVVGIKKADILRGRVFDHYLKYCVPVFSIGEQPDARPKPSAPDRP